jgi:hypothetical protein
MTVAAAAAAAIKHEARMKDGMSEFIHDIVKRSRQFFRRFL